MPNVFPTVACSQRKTWNVYYRKELDAHMSVPPFFWNKLMKVCTLVTFCFLWFAFIKLFGEKSATSFRRDLLEED